MKAYERLIEYAKVWTTSDEDSKTSPSTERQFDLALRLADEMKELGIQDARVDNSCYVYGTIPATSGYEDRPRLGFIAHLDTSPDCSGKNVMPQVHRNYDGDKLDIGNGLSLDPEIFPHLSTLKGQTLITTDGTTLLGADDKAGIAEIMTLSEILLRGEDADNLPPLNKDDLCIPAAGQSTSPSSASSILGGKGAIIPHGQISIAFTPDEEIGCGAKELDIPSFGAQYAYTVDGGAPEEINYETFNAALAVFDVEGLCVHPGSAKDIMKNAARIAIEINDMLPSAEAPQTTEGYEGFYHLSFISGNVENASLRYLVRDHSDAKFNMRQETLRLIEKTINRKYGNGTCKLTITLQYRNMEEKIRPCMHLVHNAEMAMRDIGLVPDTSPVRGGTDGSELSYRGLPCPNLGTGGYGFHSPYEHITAQNMDKVVRILMGIVERYSRLEACEADAYDTASQDVENHDSADDWHGLSGDRHDMSGEEQDSVGDRHDSAGKRHA